MLLTSDTSFTMNQLNDTVIRLGETINPGTMDVSEMYQSFEERFLILLPRLLTPILLDSSVPLATGRFFNMLVGLIS